MHTVESGINHVYLKTETRHHMQRHVESLNAAMHQFHTSQWQQPTLAIDHICSLKTDSCCACGVGGETSTSPRRTEYAVRSTRNRLQTENVMARCQTVEMSKCWMRRAERLMKRNMHRPSQESRMVKNETVTFQPSRHNRSVVDAQITRLHRR